MRKKCALSFSWFLIVILTVAISSSGAFGAEKVTIRWLYPGGDQPVSRQTWQGHLERFEAKYPNIKVELLDVPWDLVHDRLVNMIMAGDGPDVIQIGARWLPEFIEWERIR